MAVSRCQAGTSSGMCSSSRARAWAAVGRAFAPSRHHRENAGQVAARCSRIRSPGSSSVKAPMVSEISPGAGACGHGTAGTGPPAQSVAATRASQPRQSVQSTSSTHRCQSCQLAGMATRLVPSPSVLMRPPGRFPPHPGPG